MKMLGTIYLDNGMLGEAEEMCHRAAEGLRGIHGLENKSTLETMNTLGRVYVKQGKLGEAEKMFLVVRDSCDKESIGWTKLWLNALTQLIFLFTD